MAISTSTTVSILADAKNLEGHCVKCGWIVNPKGECYRTKKACVAHKRSRGAQERNEYIMGVWEACRCCGYGVKTFDGHPIHTRCIPKHWGKHSHGINASRCKEFGGK